MKRQSVLLCAVVAALVGCKSTRPAEPAGAKKKRAPVAQQMKKSELQEAREAYVGDQGAAFDSLATEAKGVASDYLDKMDSEGLVAGSEEDQYFETSMESLASQSTEELAVGLAAPGLDEIAPEAEQALLTTPDLAQNVAAMEGRIRGSRSKSSGGGASENKLLNYIGGTVLLGVGLAGAFFCGRGAWTQQGADRNKSIAGLVVSIGALFGAAWLYGAFDLTTDPTAIRKARYRQIALLELGRIKAKRDILVAALDARGMRDLGLNLGGTCRRGGTGGDKPPLRRQDAKYFKDLPPPSRKSVRAPRSLDDADLTTAAAREKPRPIQRASSFSSGDRLFEPKKWGVAGEAGTDYPLRIPREYQRWITGKTKDSAHFTHLSPRRDRFAVWSAKSGWQEYDLPERPTGLVARPLSFSDKGLIQVGTGPSRHTIDPGAPRAWTKVGEKTDLAPQGIDWGFTRLKNPEFVILMNRENTKHVAWWDVADQKWVEIQDVTTKTGFPGGKGAYSDSAIKLDDEFGDISIENRNGDTGFFFNPKTDKWEAIYYVQ